MQNQDNPIQGLIAEILEERYEGVTFSDEIINSIEAKLAPMIRSNTEDAVVEFVSDFFSPKAKPARKPRKPRAPKKEAAPKAETPAAPPEAEEPAPAPAPKPAVDAPAAPAAAPTPPIF